MTSWADKAKAGAPPPTSDQRLKSLADAYAKYEHTPKTVLREALGYYVDVLPEVPGIARPLVEHTIVICVDTESYTLNTDQMTELGLAYISRKTAQKVGAPGPHGQKLQEALQFFHFRIAEHAHLRSNREDSKGPLGNRFGHTRFITFRELREVLEYQFNQEIESNDPELKGCKRPVVLVGHALEHDVENAKKEGLNYNFLDNLSIVAKIDTQALARETKDWIPPHDMRTNEIGLKVLIEKLGFQHLDDHTACNDAARTMMCGVHMILPNELRISDSPTMQEVADRVENQSKFTSPAPYGTALCCTRCGWRDHSIEDCTAAVTCAACVKWYKGPGRDEIIHSHIETYCLRVAKTKAWSRRYRDASIKHRNFGKPFPSAVLQGPGDDAHPWSTFPFWPLKKWDDILVGLSMASYNPRLRQPPLFARNLEAALGGLPVPTTGSWITLASRRSSSDSTVTRSGVASSKSSSPAPPPTADESAVAVTSSALLAPSGSSSWFDDFPALGGSTVASTPAATSTQAPVPASATTVKREVKMSDMRRRHRGGARGEFGRGRSSGGSSGGGGGGGGGGSAASTSAGGAWDAWND